MNLQKKIVIAGGSGFIGNALANFFSARGFEVFILTRSPRKNKNGIREIFWDGQHVGEWLCFLDGADALINLTGKNVNCPHTPENVRALALSRVNSVVALVAACDLAKKPPRVWVQASAIGFYGNKREEICDENAPNGDDALAQICHDWEIAFTSAKLAGTRKVILRIGFVLGRDGGALPILARLTKLFLGGAAGDGRQFVSWIHLDDLAAMFFAAVENENLSGIFNAVAPNAVSNSEFMRELRRALRRPWSPPAPALAVKIGAWLTRSDPSLALDGQRVVPKRFLESGFEFQFSHLRAALENLYR